MSSVQIGGQEGSSVVVVMFLYYWSSNHRVAKVQSAWLNKNKISYLQGEPE